MLYSIENGSPSVMSVDKSSAAAGETVTVTNLTSSTLSWELDGVAQTDIAANGTATFTMPAGNVVVAEHVETYSITRSNCTAWAHAERTEGGQNYVVSDEITEASAGSTVYVTTYRQIENSDVNVELTYLGTLPTAGISQASVYSFTMPENDAIVGFHDR